MTTTEVPAFNLDETVQRWNAKIVQAGPTSIDEVVSLAKDSVRLAATLNGVTVEVLGEEGGEEVAWGRAGHIGLDADGEPWISVNYQLASLRAVLEHGADLTEVTEFVWKGLLLKHRLHPALSPHRDSVKAVLGVSVTW